ncbi:MAG: hypothetical protein PHQ43_10005 [Dehalococcoidales bacterium]|nr:hypothetical protein [Dehalococcoidales bacterium]
MANTFILDILTAINGEPRDYATPGDTVVVAVRLKNIGNEGFSLSLTGTQDSVQLSFSPASAWANSLQTIYFQASFTMPNKDVLVKAYGWWWNGSQWINDSQGEKSLLRSAATSEFNNFQIMQYQKL